MASVPAAPRVIDGVEHSTVYRLSPEKKVKLIAAIQAGESTTAELAKQFDLSIGTIGYYAKTYGVRPIDILNAHAVDGAWFWAKTAMPHAAKKGDHRPAMHLLEKTGHIQDSDAQTIQVQVGVALQIPNMSGPIRLDAQHLVGEATPSHEDASAVPLRLPSDDPTISGG